MKKKKLKESKTEAAPPIIDGAGVSKKGKNLKKKKKGSTKRKNKQKIKFFEVYDDSAELTLPDKDGSEEEPHLGPDELVVDKDNDDSQQYEGGDGPFLFNIRNKKPKKLTCLEKKVKIPKIRRFATSEGLEENFIIVPWKSIEEWEDVCKQLHCGNYEEVSRRIGVWQRRVPSLPVGAEATLFLLEALLYDQKLLWSCSNTATNNKIYTEDQARALYSLAIIRYLNHVNHLAAESLGEATMRPSEELAAIMETPDWLVSLRNDVSHGPKAPSIEVLRIGGNFVLQWLKEKYWKLPNTLNEDENSTEKDPFTIIGHDQATNIPHEISKLLAAYVAARIYKKRHQQSISDPDILSLLPLPSDSVPVKTKVAVASIRNSLRGYLISHPTVFCDVVSQELLPNVEFYDEFNATFHKKGAEDTEDDQHKFEQFFGIWLPIVKMLEVKGKLMLILSNLCQVIVNTENEPVWPITARWIDKILETIENSGKRYSKQLAVLLRHIVKHPNNFTHLYLDRFFKLTEPRLGPEVIEKLNLLVTIWLSNADESKNQKKASIDKALFTLDDIQEKPFMDEDEMDVSSNAEEESMSAWIQDKRGATFWREVPVGAIIP